MKIKWRKPYHHKGVSYKAGDVCDVSDEFGAGLLKHNRAALVDDDGKDVRVEKKAEVVETATVKPEAETATMKGRRKRKVMPSDGTS